MRTLTGFDPYHLQPLATLNQRKIISLPGVESELVGQTGYAVASQPALMALVRGQARALGLEGVAEGEIPQRLNVLLDSPNASLRIASKRVAETHGRKLGALLLTRYLLPFEFSTITLLMALLGASYLVRRKEQGS